MVKDLRAEFTVKRVVWVNEELEVVLHLHLSLVFVQAVKETNQGHEEKVKSLNGKIRDFRGNWEFKDLGFKSQEKIKHVWHILFCKFFAFYSEFAHFFFKTLENFLLFSISPITFFWDKTFGKFNCEEVNKFVELVEVGVKITNEVHL